MLYAAFALPMVFTSNWDVSLSFYEDPLFSNPQFSPDQIDQPSSPVDHRKSFVDTDQLPGESVFMDQDDIISPSNKNDEWNEISSWNDVALDNSPELSECSSSEIPPSLGRSRVRRRNEPRICKDDPTSSSGIVSSVKGGDPDFSRLSEVLPQNPDDATRLLGAMGDENQNSFCALYTKLVMPYGVCSQGEVMVAGILTLPSGGIFYHYTLRQFTIGMLVKS